MHANNRRGSGGASSRSQERIREDKAEAWHGLLQVQALVIGEMDRQMAHRHDLRVREFDVLITLFNAPGGRLRMSDLAARVLLSASGLSRLVDRLERKGLIAREADADDARSVRTRLTPAGLQALDEARQTHDAVIRARMTDHLTAAEARELRGLWDRILAAVACEARG